MRTFLAENIFSLTGFSHTFKRMGVRGQTDEWRLFRVIAQKRRLRLLWTLFDEGEQCVTQLQIATGMSRPNASLQLKMLRSVGLIQFRRKKMNVLYRAEADHRIACSPQLLWALRHAFQQSVSYDHVIRLATAFTHERRIEIARALNVRCRSYHELLEVCGMSSSALSRHLDKLLVRGVVELTDGKYLLAPLSDRLERIMLNVVLMKGADK